MSSSRGERQKRILRWRKSCRFDFTGVSVVVFEHIYSYGQSVILIKPLEKQECPKIVEETAELNKEKGDASSFFLRMKTVLTNFI